MVQSRICSVLHFFNVALFSSTAEWKAVLSLHSTLKDNTLLANRIREKYWEVKNTYIGFFKVFNTSNVITEFFPIYRRQVYEFESRFCVNACICLSMNFAYEGNHWSNPLFTDMISATVHKDAKTRCNNKFGWGNIRPVI